MKCFKASVENTLRRCQFRGKLGKNRGYPYWILTPNERVHSYQVPDVCAKFHQNRLKIATVRARTDKQTDRDDTGDLIICPMLCYSNGTDKKYQMMVDNMQANLYHCDPNDTA